MTQHPTDEQLVAYRYGDSEDRATIAQHLAACDACRSAFAELQAVLAAMDTLPTPERGPGFEAEIWQRLRPRLPEPASSLWAWISVPHVRDWRLAGAVAVLLFAAFLAGRFLPRELPVVPTAATRPDARERILRADVGNHLERSERVLLELTNARTNGHVDISAEQRWADDLVFANRLYRQTATQSGDAGLAAVLDELERTLLEIARTPENISTSEFDRLRRRIRARDILFKLRIVAAELRRQEQQTAAHPRREF